MSLRQKTIVIIGLTFVGLMALLYTISRFIVLDSFTQLEEKNISQNVTRATNAISDELVGLNGTAGDWASWDDTYAFVEDANEAYIENNLADATLLSLRLNLMVFIDTSGHVVFGKAVDLRNEQAVPLPQSLLAQLSSNNLLLHHPDLKKSISGIILLPEAPVLVVSRPILSSADTGPSRGTLIIGRYLDASEINHLAELTHLSLHLYRFDDPQLSSDLQVARTALSTEAPVFIQPLDAQTIAGYSLLKDIYGHPVLVARVDMPREIYQQGQASIAYLMWSLMAVGLVFGAITLLLLEKQVLSQLTHLSQSVSKIGHSGDLSARVLTKGRDEVSHLAQAINAMLGSVEQSERALREQTRRNELILQTSLDGFMVLDIKGQLREANPAFCNILGYPKEELLGRLLSDLEVQESATEATQRRIKAISNTGADFFETKYRHQGGHLVDVEVSVNYIKFGQDRFFFGFLRDITQRKRIEKSLRQSEARFAKIFQANLVAIVLSNPTTGHHLDVNDSYLRLVGYERKEIMGHTSLELGIWVNSVERDHLVKTVRTQGSARDMEITLRRKSGEIRYGLTSAEFIDLDGELCLLGMIHDITERKSAEEALRRTEEKYRLVVESSLQGIAIFQDNRVIFVNPAMCQIMGYSAAELISFSPEQVFATVYPEDQIIIIEHSRAWLQDQPMGSRYEYRIIRRDGTLRWIESSTTMIVYEGEPSLLSISLDITERKRLEEQLRQAQKMEAIGQLAGGVAHDFNNILTVIQGYTGLLLHKLGAYDPLSHDIEQIQKSAEHAAALTRQLLAFSRKQVLQPIVLDFNAIVTNLDKMLWRLIGEDIDLTILLDPTLGWIQADPGQIEQVIINLAVNARDAMPQGGKLTIETKNVYLDEAYVQQHVDVKAGPYVMLALSDTGSGMDEETRSHIFEPFFTTKEQGKGTGLGLATVHGIVKQSDGHIWVYSEPGQGTTFKVYLPQAKEADYLTKPDIQNAAPPKRGSETLLLVEDEASVRELARRALLNEGYMVLEASHGEEALRVGQQYQGRIDLLVTDVVMPGGISGRQLAERLTLLRQEMKVLYMSGYTDDAIVRHGVLNADIAFLQKPFTPNILLRKVREVLDAA